MIGHPCATPKLCAVSDIYAAGNASVGGHNAVASHADVVGDLHQVVDFRILPDHGVIIGPAVNGCVGPDGDPVLNDHATQLWDIDQARRARSRAKTRFANDGTAVNLHPIPDQRKADGDIGRDLTVPTNRDPRPNHRIGPDAGASPDLRAGTNHHTWAQPDVGFQQGVIGDSLIRSGARPVKTLRRGDIGRLRVGCDQTDAAGGYQTGQIFRNKTGPRLGLRQLRRMAAITEEGHAVVDGSA